MAAPTAPARVRSIADGQRCSSPHRYLLHLSVGEKSHPCAVGGEEGVDGSFRSGDGPSFHTVHRPQIKLLGATVAGDIRDVGAVGRKSHSWALIQTCQLLT